MKAVADVILRVVASLLAASCASPGAFAATATNSAGTLDPAFNPALGWEVRNMVLRPDGKIIATGFGFGLVQLLPGGAVDPDFTADTGPGHNGIYGLALQSDGKVLFGSAPGDGDPHARLVRRLNTNGSLDSSFVPFQGAFFAWGKVFVPLTNGQLLAGGFATLNLDILGLLRINADGSRDTNFAEVILNFTYGDSLVHAMAVRSNGQILIGGNFITINGDDHKCLARLNADGTVDSSFVHTSQLRLRNDPFNLTPTNDRAAVFSLLELPDGKILVGGSFDLVQGMGWTNIARFNADGSVDATFRPGRGTDGTVLALARQVDGKILIGGAFTEVDGVNRRGIARLEPDGRLDLTFDPGSGTDGPVNAIALQKDGGALVGGNFTTVNGTAVGPMARLQTHGAFRVAEVAWSSGNVRLTLSTQPTKAYALEQSVNLADWTPVQTNIAESYSLDFGGLSTVAIPMKFFRGRQVEP